MQQVSEQKRMRSFVLAGALALTCGFATLPQQALAEGVDDPKQMEEPVAIVDATDKTGEAIAEEVNTVGVQEEAPVEADKSATAGETFTEPEIDPAQSAETTDAEAQEPKADAVEPGTETPASEAEATTPVEDEKPVEPVVAPAEEKKPAEAPAKAAQPAQQKAADVKGTNAKTTTVKAQAGTPKVKDGTYIIQSGIATGSSDKTSIAELVLSLQGNAVKAGTQVMGAKYQNNANKQTQWWVVTRNGDTDFYTIAAYKNTNLLVTLKGGKLVLAERDLDLVSQLWNFMTYGRNYGTSFQIRPAENAAKAADVRGGKATGGEIIAYEAKSKVEPNQEYYLVDPLFPTVKAGEKNMQGRYRMLASGTNNAVEIRRAVKDNGASIWLWTNNNQAHQNIYLQDMNNGFYIAWNMGTGKVFDVAHSSILVGANIIQWSYNGNANQQWAVRKNADGTYTLVNRATNLVFGAATSAATAPNCANIAGTQDNGRNTNNFTLKYLSLYPNNMICKIWNAGNKQVLDVSRSSTANNAKVAFWKDNGQNNQRFQIVNVGKDLYRIRTASSGGWLVYNGNNLVQQGNHATAKSNANTWQLLWRNGNYQFKNVATGKILGNASIRLYSAPMTIKEGIFEINAKLNRVTLDNPGSSKKSGTRVNVYPDKNGINQRWTIQKSGSFYKITNTLSGLALCTAGQNIALYRPSSSKDQLWSIGIADGGYIKFVNNKNGQVLDIVGSGNSVANNKSTATQLAADSASREARQSWKIVTAYGWRSADSKGNRVYMRSDGGNVKMTASGYNAWKNIQGKSSSTRYAVVIDNRNCRTYIFTGAKGNWEPCADWICTVGTSPERGGDATFGETFRGTSSILKKGKIMGQCPYELFWTEFYINDAALSSDGEGQRFHSILYLDTEGKQVYDGTLGQQASHGCVRLSLENAKWMYYNVPIGSFVWSY